MMKELRAQYAANLPGRIASLQSALVAYKAGDGEGLNSLRRVAHALRGSGASYGFPAISTAAAALEDAPEASVPARVEALIAVLEAPEVSDEELTLVLITSDTDLQDQLRERLADPNRKIRVAASGSNGLELISKVAPALIVLDLVLPDVDGRRLLETLRATQGLEDVPVIVVASKGNTRLREECFALGADQYFDKACDLSLLSVTVDSALRRLLKPASSTQLRIMSRLLSKNAFEESYARARRGKSCLILIELGDLPAGDDGNAVLHRIAGVLLKNIRGGDQLARWANTQLVLLASTRRAAANQLVRRLGAALEEQQLQVGGQIYQVTFQAGIAALDRNPPPLEEAIRRATLALEGEQERLGTMAGSRAADSQTVVLAEDDPEFATLVKYVLAEGGLNVVHFPSGAGVIEASLELDVALFVLDGMLPDVDGFELLRLLREGPMREVPVALLTALGQERDIVRGLELGADDYIVKPCSPKELLARVRKLLRQRTKTKERELGVGGISGRFQGDQLVELLQMLGSSGKSGRLTVWGEQAQGQIDLLAGEVVDASSSGAEPGAESAHRLLLADEGRFEFNPESLVSEGPLKIGVGPLLMESMRRRDEGP